MILGFTGTRVGLTISQHRALEKFLKGQLPELTQVVHGDCVGADAEFDALCAKLGLYRIARPGTNYEGRMPTRAWCKADHICEPKQYLVRDVDIAKQGIDGLIACPKGMMEERRSGTWYTVRQARKLGRAIYIVYPNGDLGITPATKPRFA